MTTRFALIFSILTLIAGCHTRPPAFPLPVTESQQETLSAIYLDVWRESRSDSRNLGGASRTRIHRLLAEEDDRIRASLDDEQWQVFDAQYRDDWVSKIYRSTRNLAPVQTSGPKTTLPSINTTSAPPNN